MKSFSSTHKTSAATSDNARLSDTNSGDSDLMCAIIQMFFAPSRDLVSKTKKEERGPHVYTHAHKSERTAK